MGMVLSKWHRADDAGQQKGTISMLCTVQCRRVQSPVTFPIGDHVNVLHDYKKTGPSKILKRLTCRYHLHGHGIDMVIEFSQSLVLVTHLKCLNVQYPSIFTNFCMNYYAHVPCCEKIAKNPSAY